MGRSKSKVSEELIDVKEKDATPKEHVPSISYFTLYRYASRWDKMLIAIAIVASVIVGAIIPYAITTVANTFHNMVMYAKAKQIGIDEKEEFLGQMHRFGILYSCIGVVIFLGAYLGSALMNIAAINQVFKIREAYFKAALNQDFAYFDVRQTGDFASKMADDIIKLEEGIGDKMSALFFNLTTAVSCVAMAVYKGWKLALLCLTTAPVTFILVGLSAKLVSRLSKKEAMASGRASAVAQEVLASIRTVYAFNGQQKELLRYKEPLAQARKIKILREFFVGVNMGFLFFCIFGSYALSFYLGIYLVINDPKNYNADVMFSVFIGVMTGMGNLGMMGSLMDAFSGAKGAGAQIFNLISNVPTINPMLERGFIPTDPKGNIELINVVFKYPARPTVTVLNGVSLKIKRGTSVAFVGQSGCGKSTILSLVSRYYDVLDGSVLLDGYDVRDLSVSWLRSQIGVVNQEPTLFNATVRENIRYGRDDATDDEVEASAKMANAHNFIVKLPKGYNTQVGERGASLSGGQKQRIAIARALVRNPLILILDEATSALDMTSEAKVRKALEIASEGRTTISVAHRLSTIRNVDVIYVMAAGKVIEMGTHDQLMRNRGHYFDMVITQEPNILTSTKDDGAPAREESESVIEMSPENADTNSLFEEKDGLLKGKKLSFWTLVGLNSPEWKSITVGCISSILMGFSMPLFIIVFGDMFGAMSDLDTNVLMRKGVEIAVHCILIGVVMAISNLAESLSFGIAGAYLTERLRLRMFAHMLQQDISFFDNRANSTGALCARLSAEAAYVQGATGQRIGIVLQGLGSIGLAIVVGMLSEWRVGMIVLAFFPIIATVIYFQSKETSKESSHGIASLENSTKTTQSLQMASNQLQNAFNFAPNFQKGINAASRIVAQLQHKPKIFDPVVPAVIGFVPTSKGDAHLKEVKFRYPSRPNVEVFHKLNIKVESGKTVALVGTSGSGKSTVIQLLQRFYDPDSGAVYLDQYPLPNLRLNEVRSVFGLVSQEPILFDRSIMENIAYGVNDRIPKMEEVTDSARKANIHDFIVSLPKGYETNIGSKGVQLSGGQKQRVAIARALIRQPKILLLDEATSALDTESEKVVIQALDEARSGRTCIVIAHRLSTIRDADVIQVIDAGVVVETGTHDQLLNAKGVYANLYHAGR